MRKFGIVPGVAVAAAGVALLTSSYLTGAIRNVDKSVVVTTSRGEVEVTPLSNDIFRVRQLGKPSDSVKFMKSQSAVMTPEDAEVIVIAYPDRVELQSPTTKAVIDKATGQVRFMTISDSLLLEEKNGIDNHSETKTVSFTTPAGEFFYGGGERGHKSTVNGDSLTMYNRQNYGYTKGDPRISQMGISVPYFVSDKGYGVLIDDFDNASLQLTDSVIEYKSPTHSGLSYYFINGKGTLAGATDGYTRLTGRQPLPPFWTLGYVTSKYGYHNTSEALGAIDSLKTRGYPVDGIVFDLYWYGKETDMGRLEWNKEQWGDHRELLRQLKEKGVNTVLITQPYINKIGAIDNYNLLSEQGMLVKDAQGNTHDVTTWVGDAGMFDVSNPSTRRWLWQHLNSLTGEGVAGWWGDLGEPEVHPLTIMHSNGLSASQFHNVYGNEWSRIIYEGLRKDYPTMRPMLMMRGGTAGLQRYGVFPWTTDVSRSWGGFQPQVNLMLSSGLSGLGYMGSDVGGFAVDPEHPTDSELYVRWLQTGVFTPMLRTHAQYKPEPYHYPEMEKITRRFIKMRYEWLPYNYTLAWENATTGAPLARPLNFRGENPGKKYAEVEDEYMWGDEVLVAPVMTKGARSRKVLFPAGEWIDWNNPRLRYKGGSVSTVKAPLDRLPLFVRAGAFIPQYMRPIENVEQYDPQYLTVKYFPSEKPSEYVLFDDDRKNPESIADGAYQLTTFIGEKEGKVTTIEMRTSDGDYAGMPPFRMVTLEIVGVPRPAKVEWNDDIPMPYSAGVKGIRQSGWTYDAVTRTVIVQRPWEYNPVTLRLE